MGISSIKNKLLPTSGLAIWRAEGITISSGNSNQLRLGQKYFNLAFCCYLYLQYFNHQRLRADEFQIRHIAKPYRWQSF
jgi:hypothetical protein